MKKDYIIPTIENLSLTPSSTILKASYVDPSETEGGNTGALSAPERRVF